VLLLFGGDDHPERVKGQIVKLEISTEKHIFSHFQGSVVFTTTVATTAEINKQEARVTKKNKSKLTTTDQTNSDCQVQLSSNNQPLSNRE
jgi:hypothetical protein